MRVVQICFGLCQKIGMCDEKSRESGLGIDNIMDMAPPLRRCELLPCRDCVARKQILAARVGPIERFR